jgi:hypothetical protein
MRSRTEALLGLGALAALVALAAALGQRENRGGEGDPRPSTLLAGPRGAQGLAEALSRLGLRVVRFRRGLQALPHDSAGGRRTVLALLEPSEPLSASEAATIREWNERDDGGDLLLAGRGTGTLMRCFGYAIEWRSFDSVTVRPPGVAAANGRGTFPPVAAVLAATTDTIVADSSRVADTQVNGCTVAPISAVDTLLMSTSGRAIALRLHRSDTPRSVVLLADVGLLRNRALRETEAGPFALGLFTGRYDRVIFEEAHHGFGAGGSLAGATLEWSWRSPWGWGMWQLAFVGLLALIGGAIRFGRPRLVLGRRRRSPLEHVRALATALAAARGHDVAISAIVEGLRRRLQPAGQRARGDVRPWLDHLAGHVQTPRARAAVGALQTLTRPGQSPEGVLRAANAVEDVWEELRP